MLNSQLRNSQLPTRTLGFMGVVRLLVLGVGILGVGSLAACAKARAESVPDGPPLSVPRPPDRVLAPSEPPPLPVAGAPLPETPPPAASPRVPPRPAPPAPREAEQRPPAPAAPAAPPADATRDLRPAASNNAATERAVRDVLVRATRDLARIDYGKLSTAGRAQYDQSKRFSQQAEQALKDRNVVFAQTLAEKAATLAAELSGR